VITVTQVLAEARSALAAHSESAALDAELLLAHLLGRSRTRLRLTLDATLDRQQLEGYRALLQRRIEGESVAYLVGHRGFWSLDLTVSAAVLVPRPETELLVELALEALRGRVAPRVLDLGTGSGAVALALAHERPDAQIDAVDLSPEALAVARQNAERLGLGQVRWLEGSWWAPVAGQRYAVIVANPPYLGADDPHLPALRHEPRLALVSGPTGLEALETLALEAAAYLDPNGQLLVEHGHTQGAAVRALFARGGLTEVATARDLAGLERTTHGRATG
jgi:release factor glutamine methyltransferase